MRNIKDQNGNPILASILPDYILRHDGNLEAVAEELLIDYAVLQRHVSSCDECREMLSIVRERTAQRAEQALKDRIASGDTKAILYALNSLKPDVYGESKTVTLKTPSKKEAEEAVKAIFGIQKEE